MLLEGPQGVGKTRLLDEARAIAPRNNVVPLTGVADQLLQLVPLAPLLGALGRFSLGSPAEPDPDRDEPCLRAIERIKAQLEEHARHRPTLVTVDDLQWADQTTLLALRMLPHALAGRRSVWGLTRRSLSTTAVDEMVADLLGAPSVPEIRALAGGADGNPHVVTELVGGMREEGTVRVRDGTAWLVEDPHRANAGFESPVRLPSRYRTFIARRLQALNPRTRRLLETAAVLGSTFHPDDVAEMTGTPAAALLASVQEALHERLLACTSDAVCVRQQVVWQGVLQSIPAPLRNSLHRQAAQMLLRRGSATTDAAMHVARGARRGRPVRRRVPVVRRSGPGARGLFLRPRRTRGGRERAWTVSPTPPVGGNQRARRCSRNRPGTSGVAHRTIRRRRRSNPNRIGPRRPDGGGAPRRHRVTDPRHGGAASRRPRRSRPPHRETRGRPARRAGSPTSPPRVVHRPTPSALRPAGAASRKRRWPNLSPPD